MDVESFAVVFNPATEMMMTKDNLMDLLVMPPIILSLSAASFTSTLISSMMLIVSLCSSEAFRGLSMGFEPIFHTVIGPFGIVVSILTLTPRQDLIPILPGCLGLSFS